MEQKFKIVVDINHPSDVHFFKNFIWRMKKKGHEILIIASKKDVSTKLLDNYDLDFINVGSYGKSLIKKVFQLFILDLKMYNAVKKFKPDIFIGAGSLRSSHLSRIIKKTSIIFEDTEHAVFEHILYIPFAEVVCTPSCYMKDLGKKQIRYNGYKELAYLHPNIFTPNPAILDDMGIREDKFIILRFVSWDATHDIHEHGIRNKIAFVKELEKNCRVLITSERIIDRELEKYQIKVPPEKIHDLLYYASLYVGEGATMATESAILGTPSIYVSSLSGKIGNLIELEQKYGLIYSYNNQEEALKKAIELIKKPNIKEDWSKKKEILLKDKIDVNEFMVKFVESYIQNKRTI